jgi:signal transduction histidine kinase
MKKCELLNKENHNRAREIAGHIFNARTALEIAPKAREVHCGRYDTQPQVPEALIGDPGRIRQVLVNLLGNAIKFTERGEVFITVREESQEDSITCLHFMVKDTGVGIPADKRDFQTDSDERTLCDHRECAPQDW